jgi:indolepyruvate ferredoxin oxidoreductase alpha subunit
MVVVLDNSITAMTDHQPHPGTGLSAVGEPAPRVPAENILQALGYKTYVINPLNVKESIEVVTKAFEEYKRGERVAIVSRARCALLVLRDARRRKITLPVYRIDENRCTGCMVCVNLLGSPAIIVDPGAKKPRIDPTICAGCGLCAAVCPYKAIVLANKPSENWRELW